MEDKIKSLCADYIHVIAMAYTHNIGATYSWNARRTDIHDRLIEELNCDPGKLQIISGSLDVWIGFPASEEELTNEKIESLGVKLNKLLTSDFFTKSDYGAIRDKHKELSKKYLDDINFDGFEFN